MEDFDSLNTNLTPEEIPCCGRPLVKEEERGYLWWGSGRGWKVRLISMLETYPEAVCGDVDASPRRCTRCMKAAGVIW